MTRCVALAYVCRRKKKIYTRVNKSNIHNHSWFSRLSNIPHHQCDGDGRYHSCIFASPRYWLVIVLFYNDIACVNAIFLQDMHLKLLNTGGCQNHTTYWVATRFVEHIVTDEIQPYKANCNFPPRSSCHPRCGRRIVWSAGLSSGPATVFFSRSR